MKTFSYAYRILADTVRYLHVLNLELAIAQQLAQILSEFIEVVLMVFMTGAELYNQMTAIFRAKGCAENRHSQLTLFVARRHVVLMLRFDPERQTLPLCFG